MGSRRKEHSGPTPAADQLADCLFRATSDCALLMDTEGTILVANQALAGLLRTPLEQLHGRNFFAFFDPEAASRRRAMADMVVRFRAPVHYEDTATPGAVYDTRAEPILDKRGEVSRIAVFFCDVTARRRAERERVRLATAIQQAAEVVVICSPNLVVEYVNQAFEEMSGFPEHEARGMPLEALFQGGPPRRAYQRLSQAMARGDAWTGRVSLTRKDKRRLRCEMTFSPVRVRRGVVQGFVGVWRDVTEVERLERQVRKAQRMEALGALAGGIAHDFNNILGPIILHAEMGLSGLPAAAPARGLFANILQAAERARSLAAQILNLGRQREGEEPIPFRLSSLLKECMKLLGPTLPPRVSLHHVLHTTEDFVLADPAQLHQVVMNLATNALHAMEPDGGRLTCEVDLVRAPEEEPPAGWDLEPGEYVRLVMSDTGAGMTRDVLARIFDPFFTTRKDGLGTGLGLAVVQGVVARLGGTVTVQSEPGSGSVFQVFIPRSAQRPMEAVPLADADRRGLPRGRERIMVVDDERGLRESCAASLRELGYRVTACAHGREALVVLRRAPRRFDLVLSNVVMSDVTGFDLLDELDVLNPGIPVVFLSGDRELLQAALNRTHRPRACLAKPFRWRELAECVRGILDREGAVRPEAAER
ncbi:MAG: PAS domain-containing protein [Thermodesulfobacteriota bacterium]